jgi:hypothetical protein
MGKKEKDIDKLIRACDRGELKEVRRLVKKGVSLDQAGEEWIPGDEGWTPLEIAAWSGQIEVVKYLVKVIGDVNATDELGRTALHAAAAGGHIDVAEYLIDAGADVNWLDVNNNTALHYVMGLCPMWEKFAMFRFLVDRGVDATVVNVVDETVLDMAVERRYHFKDEEFEQIVAFFKKNYPELVMDCWTKPKGPEPS